MASELEARIRLLENQVQGLASVTNTQSQTIKTISLATTSLTQSSNSSNIIGNLIIRLKNILRNGFVWVGQKVDVDHGGAQGLADPDHVETSLSLSDNTTNDMDITRHGFCPKAPNDTAKYLRGDATWAALASLNIETFTADDTLDTANDIAILNKATAITLNLPAATGSAKLYYLKNIGVGAATIDPDGAETIDGSASLTLNQWDAAIIVDYASGQWLTLGAA